MIVIENREYILFKIKRVWFSQHIFDVSDCDVAIFFWCKEKFDSNDFTRGEWLTSVIDLTQDIDKIWSDMEKKSCRYAIKRAQRDGIEIKINEHFEEFYRILRSFSKQRRVAYLEVNLPTLKKGTLFTAELGGEILAGHVYLENNEVMFYWRAASMRAAADKEKATLIGNASHLIHWEAMKYAKNKGIKEFDMGGLIAGEGNDYPGHSRDAFKESFGGKRVIRYTYQRHYTLSGKLYALGQGLRRLYRYLKSKNFFVAKIAGHTHGGNQTT